MLAEITCAVHVAPLSVDNNNLTLAKLEEAVQVIFFVAPDFRISPLFNEVKANDFIEKFTSLRSAICPIFVVSAAISVILILHAVETVDGTDQL